MKSLPAFKLIGFLHFFFLKHTDSFTIYTENYALKSHPLQQTAARSPSHSGRRYKAGAWSLWGAGQGQSNGHTLLCTPHFPPTEIMVVGAGGVVPLSHPNVGSKHRGDASMNRTPEYFCVW